MGIEDWKNEEHIKKLGIKGKKPTDGVITINKKGDIYLEVIYGEIIYVKLPNENKITKDPMVIGDYNEWITDGNGTIIEYKNNIESQLEALYGYIELSTSYAFKNEDSYGYTIDYTKDLKENVPTFEQHNEVSRSGLPQELNKEIDILFDIFNTNEDMNEEQVYSLFDENKNKIPFINDFFNVIVSGDDYTKTNAYKLIESNMGISNTFTVPNYVKHEDGKLEKITSLADNSIATFNSGCPTVIHNKNLVIPYGIENIGASTFVGCLLNNVTFASTVKVIGDHAFALNNLSSLVLPKSLQTIGETAFEINNISGELTIPNNVTFIGWGAFHSTEMTQDNCGNSYLCNIVGKKNSITKVTFEEGSKIEIIAANAFKDNLLTTLVIPGSIKEFGNFAFNMPTLASVTVNRLKGSDLSIGYDVFGSAKVEYIQ